MEFSRQEYWSGFSFPSPGDLPDPGMERVSQASAGMFFTSGVTWKAQMWIKRIPIIHHGINVANNLFRKYLFYFSHLSVSSVQSLSRVQLFVTP